MAQKRSIENARQGDDGTISHVRLEGNQNHTKVEKVIERVEKGTLELENAHVVHPQESNPYLRTNPDRELDNNLESMADS